jgi:hypothetical protein
MHQRRNQQIGESGSNEAIPARIDVQKLDYAKPGLFFSFVV